MTETPQQAARRLSYTMLSMGFEPTALHEYTRGDGEATHYRIRLKHPETGEKWIRPMRKNGNGFELAEPEFPNGKPLYRLHDLSSKPGAPCWYVEGENCADALAKLGVLATTAGSATSDDKADFSPLARRTVTIWPDNDKPGIEHAQRVAEKLRALRCQVEILNASALGLKEGEDCVEWLRAHPGAPADLAKLPRLPPDERRNRFADQGSEDDGSSGLILRRVCDVQARAVRWLWQGRIARGKVTILAGNPGLGKSQLCASIAAIVSTGGTWPVDGTRCERGSVLIFSAEDDAEDTIRPRLEAVGADLGRVHVLDAVAQRESNGSVTRRAFSLVKDMPRLAAKLAEMQDVALVVIDPITAYMGETDSHKNAEVRALLSQVAEVAGKHGVSVIAVSHLRKSGAGEAMQQITGSLAFVAAARAAYVVAKDQGDAARRLLLPVKNNLGDDQTGYAFRIEPTALAGGIRTSRVGWEGQAVTTTADEALAPPEYPEERGAVDEAAGFLRALLADAPMPAKRIKAEAEDAGHNWAAIRRAQKAVGILAVREGGMADKGRWVWRLPPKVLKDSLDAHVSEVDALGGNEHLRDDSGDGERY